MKDLILEASYGELWCPDSMVYCNADDVVLEIIVDQKYDCPEMQQLLADIDALIRSKVEVL